MFLLLRYHVREWFLFHMLVLENLNIIRSSHWILNISHQYFRVTTIPYNSFICQKKQLVCPSYYSYVGLCGFTTHWYWHISDPMVGHQKGTLSVPITSDQLRSSSSRLYVLGGTLIYYGWTMNSRHVYQKPNHQKSCMSVHFLTGRVVTTKSVLLRVHEHLAVPFHVSAVTSSLAAHGSKFYDVIILYHIIFSRSILF